LRYFFLVGRATPGFFIKTHKLATTGTISVAAAALGLLISMLIGNEQLGFMLGASDLGIFSFLMLCMGSIAGPSLSGF
jgi:hypothetical protein